MMMAIKLQILEALEKTERKLPLKPMDIARQLGRDENPRVISVQLHRLADEGFIKKKGSKSGWYITELGKLRLQISKRQTKRQKSPERKEPPERKSEWARIVDEQIEESKGSNYELFLQYGKSAAVATKTASNLLLVAAEHADTGNLEDLQWVKQAFDEMVLPHAFKKIWFNLWAGYIKRYIPSQRNVPSL
jgi:predicted transcriptional regulator